MHSKGKTSSFQNASILAYLSDDQVDALITLVRDGNKRIDAVNRITSNSSAIVASAAHELFAEQPQLTAPGGNAYTNRRLPPACTI